MNRKLVLAAGTALVATVALLAAVTALATTALAAKKSGGPLVTVRVEGLNKTLLVPTKVHTPTKGSITKGGAPKGACPASTAAGDLDVATKHKWNGTYSSSLGIEVTSILGETHTFSSPNYWSIWLDNHFAPAGICALKLHKGQTLLFAAVSQKGNPFPLSDTAPKSVHAGKTFAVKVLWWPAKGKAKPLAGVTVKTGKLTATTNSHGVARLKAKTTGTLTISANKTGYIRAAPLSVRVM